MSYGKILKQIAKRWYIVLITMLVALTACIVFKAIFVKTEYISSASCYVSGVYDLENGNDLTDGMLNNFLNLSKTSSILGAVAEDASIKMLGYSADELILALEIYRQNNLIVINCKMRDPIDAQLIAQAYLNTGLPKAKSFLASSIQDFQYTVVSSPEEGKVIDNSAISAYLLSLLVGCMAGVFFALLPLIKGKVAYEYAEIQPMFNTPLIAVLPDKNLRQIGKAPIDSNALLIEYDVAIGALIAAIQGNNCQSAMIVPCTERVKINDIMMKFGEISAKNHTTVVVDADFRTSQSAASGDGEILGLSDYIMGKTMPDKLENVADNYTKIHCGKSCASAVPLLMSGYADEIFKKLIDKYDSMALIVPPIDKYRDCLSLGKSVQGAVLVIEATSKNREIRAAIDKLDQSGIKLLGITMVNYPKY